MKFDSPYFETTEKALGSAESLVSEDAPSAVDRQVIANFYNGRDTMSVDTAEKEGLKNVVNHLFGYNALDQLRQQISSVISADDETWKIQVTHPDYTNDASMRQQIEAHCAYEFNLRVKRSKRFKPEWRSLAGNVVLHGRDTLCMVDKFDWCPRSSFIYVPGDTGTTAETFTYGFKADRIPLWRLKGYLKKAESLKNPTLSGWNVPALKDAIDSIENGCGAGVNNAITLDTHEKESENDSQDNGDFGGRRSSSMTMPVWYLYEVDHDKPSKPVGLTIIARYTYASDDNKGEEKKREREILLYSKKDHFSSVRHWLFPFFIDTEIGGISTWHGTMGIGKLNYPRDADVEEFFNLAMDGAKDNCRQKWQMADGASREKAHRFFQERGDLVPEGLSIVPQQGSGQFKEAFTVIGVLQNLSKEDAGTGFSNGPASADELQIQAQERQSRASALIAARMTDIYDNMDDVGTEMFRRFCIGDLSESNPGYIDIKTFRDNLSAKGITAEMLQKICEMSDGVMKYVIAKTSRAAGDGSPSREMAVNDRILGSLGLFSPQGQEIIKRRVLSQWTRDPDFAREIVPYQKKTDPDQLARARNENTAALSRGIVGFIPEINADDVAQIHIPEHDSEIDAVIARAVNQGYMTPFEAAGFKSLASHQAAHLQSIKGDKRTAEAANSVEQKLQEQSRQAEGLIKAFETNGPGQQSELDEKDRIKFQQKQRDQDHQDRQQTAVEQDRAERRRLDEEKFQLDQVVRISDASTKAAKVTTPTNQNIQTNEQS